MPVYIFISRVFSAINNSTGVLCLVYQLENWIGVTLSACSCLIPTFSEESLTRICTEPWFTVGGLLQFLYEFKLTGNLPVIVNGKCFNLMLHKLHILKTELEIKELDYQYIVLFHSTYWPKKPKNKTFSMHWILLLHLECQHVLF